MVPDPTVIPIPPTPPPAAAAATPLPTHKLSPFYPCTSLPSHICSLFLAFINIAVPKNLLLLTLIYIHIYTYT
jgi:hypothetical protein